MVSEKTFISEINASARRAAAKLQRSARAEADRIAHDAILVYLADEKPRRSLEVIAEIMNARLKRSYTKFSIKSAINAARRRESRRLSNG